MDDSLKEIEKFEKRFNLPSKFYLNLLKDSDWGFIIKLHSLFEGASTHILNLRLGAGKIEEAIAYLDFSNNKFGKVKLLASLGVLNDQQVAFLRLLSELRNELVHRIENVTFTFDRYLEKNDKNKIRSFCKRVGYNCNDPIKIGDKSVTRNQFICENVKLSIWLTASDVLACLRVEEEFVNLEKEKREQEKTKLDFARKIMDMNNLIHKVLLR